MRKNNISGKMKRILAVACAGMLAITSVPANTVAYASENTTQNVNEEENTENGNDVDTNNDVKGTGTDGQSEGSGEANSGENSGAANSGDNSGAGNSGDNSGAGNSGDNSGAGNSGDNSGAGGSGEGSGTGGSGEGTEAGGQNGTSNNSLKGTEDGDTPEEDTTAPTISAKVNGEAASSNTYYFNTEEVKVTFVADEEPDADGWNGTYKFDGSEKSFAGSGTEVEITLTDEGEYKNFAVSGKDEAGNPAQTDSSVSGLDIVIDRTAPEVTAFTVDTEAWKTEDSVYYFNEAASENGVVITFKLSEAISSSARSDWSVKYGVTDGSEGTALDIASWADDGKSFTVKLTENGEYKNFAFDGKDTVGIELDDGASTDGPSVVIQKAPTVSVNEGNITPEADKDEGGVKSYSGTTAADGVEIKFSVSDKIDEADRSDWSVKYGVTDESEGTALDIVSWSEDGLSFTVKITNEEGEYKNFVVSGTDAYENNAACDESVDNIDIVIDKSAPTVEASVQTEAYKAEDGKTYFNEEKAGNGVEVSFALTEAIDEADRSDWKASCKLDGEETELTITWEDDGKSFTVTLTEDGEYKEFSVSGTDAVGYSVVNGDSVSALDIYIDTEAPEVKNLSITQASVVDGVWVGPNTVVVKFNVEDATGVASVMYCVSKSSTAPEDDSAYTTVSAGSNGTYTITIPPQKKGTIYIRTKDTLDNTSTSSTTSIIIENLPPDLTVSVDNASTSQKVHTFSISADDQPEEDTVSTGLKSIYYYLDGSTQKKVIKSYQNSGQAYQYTTNLNISDLDGEHSFEFWAVDFANNSIKKTVVAYFDNKKPTIDIQAESGKFIKDTEGNFVTNDGSITVKVDDEAESSEPAHGVYATVAVKKDGSDLTSLELNAAEANTVSNTYALSDLSITEEGSYEITVTAHDGAGNNAESKSYAFVVDRTAPEYTCTVVDEGSVIDEILVFNHDALEAIKNSGKDGVEVKFTVTEDHMTSDSWTYSYKINGTSAGGTIENWSKSGNAYTFSLYFEEEGLYTDFQLTGKDAAGNAAAYAKDETSPEFVISAKVPTVTLKMTQTNDDNPDTAEDESLYHNNGGFSVLIKIKDDSYDSNITEYTITVKGDGGQEYVKTETGSFNREKTVTITDDELKTGLGVTAIEAELTVTVTASTNMGNTTSAYTAGRGITVYDGDETEGKFYYDTIAPKLVSVASEAEAEFLDGEDGFYYVSSSKVIDTYTIDDKYPGITKVSYSQDDLDTEFEVKTTDEGQEPKVLTVKLEGEDNKFTAFKVTGTDLAGNNIVIVIDEDDDNKYKSIPDNVNAAEAGDGCIKLTYGKVLDTVAPVLKSITSDAGGKTFYDGEDELFYVSSEIVTDTYVIEDTNIGNTEVNYKKDAEDQEPVKTSGDQLVVTLDGEGIYSDFIVTGADKAGNKIVVVADEYESTPEDVNAVESDESAINLSYGKVLDVTAPTVAFAATEREDSDTLEGTRRYYNDDFNGTFTVTDNNTLLSGNIKAYLYKAEEAEEDEHYNDHADSDFVQSEEITTEDNQAATITYSKDIEANDEHTTDGNYRFYIEGYDKAHNAIVVASDQPSGEMALTAKDYEFDEEDSDGFISKDKVLDTVAPVATLRVFEFKTVKEGDETVEKDLDDFYKLEMTAENYKLDPYDPFQKKINSKIKLTTTDKSPVSFSYDIDSTVEAGKQEGITKAYANDANKTTKIPAREQIITIKNLVVKDRAGNLLALEGDPKNKDTEEKKTLHTSNKLFYDNTTPTTKPKDIVAPTATIKATSSVTHRNADGRDLFNHAVTLNVTITDPGSNVYSSGLKDASYEVYVDGKKVKSDSVSYSVNSASDALNETTAKVKNDKLTFTKKFTISLPTSYQSNDIEIRVNAVDHSGNKMSTVKYRCGIDTVGPKITVSYDNNSAQNEKYFKADRTATITVIDRNVDNGKIHINTQVSVPGSFSYSSGGGNGANDKWTKQLHYNTDGDYTLDLPNCTDALGNKATVTYEGTAPKEFTIDKTIPVIYVTFDNNSAQNGKYYKDPRTATVRIHEHNFRASDVKVSQTATIQKGSVSAPGVGGFGGGGDDHSANINYSNDGNYTLEVNYTDLAGNPAKVVKVDEFVIDQTKPVVKFINPKSNNMVFQDEIAPEIEYSDINTTRGMASITLKGMKKSNVLEVAEDTFSDYVGTVKFENLKKIRENDDIYTATAVVTDLAGNEESISITFSVNRFGSTYDYNNDKFTTDLVEKYYTSEEGDVVLREINVNRLTEHSLTRYKDGENRKLVEGTDYDFKENQVNGHYEYIYTIFAKNFEEEGNYNIIATSKDEAKNTNSNSSVKGNDGSNEVPLRFAVDKTAPTNEITGVDMTKDKFTETEIVLDIRPVDNMNAVATFLVRVINKDGTEEFEMSGEELAKYLEEHDGKYTLTVEQNTGWQTIEVITTDAAGNQSTDYTVANNTAYDVLVTPNLFYQYINRLPLVLLTIAAIAGIIFFIIWKRKKDQEENTAA